MTSQLSLQQNAHTASIRFKLNGKPVSIRAPRAKTLLRLLREDFGLTGAKPGCEAGECGACTVLLDGKPVTSCMVLAAQAEGREVTTVEGLSSGRRVDPIIQELVAQGAVQCGYCIPGIVVVGQGIAQRESSPHTWHDPSRSFRECLQMRRLLKNRRCRRQGRSQS